MNFVVLAGQDPHLVWLGERLFRQGLPIVRVPSPTQASGLPGVRGWVLGRDAVGAVLPCCRQGDVVLDLSATWFAHLAGRAEGLHQQGVAYVEAAGPLSSLGVELGFALAVGGDALSSPPLTALLNALAPWTGGWCVAGGVGSAAFSRTVAEAFQHVYLSSPSPLGLYAPADLRAAMKIDHTALFDHILEAARLYLALYPQEISFASTLAHFLLEVVQLGQAVDVQLRDWLASQFAGSDNATMRP